METQGRYNCFLSKTQEIKASIGTPVGAKLKSCVKEQVLSGDNETTPTPKAQRASEIGGRKTIRVRGPESHLGNCISFRNNREVTPMIPQQHSC